MTLLEQALIFAAMGFPVVPLHTPINRGEKPCSCNKTECENVGKHPRTMHGLSDATTEEEKIRYWWGLWPEANIGILTGEKPGCFVLDIDPKNGGSETMAEIVKQYGTIDDKAIVKTGSGGWHYFFKYPEFPVANTQGSKTKPSYLGAGLDLRGNGGYVVAAGSLHQSGKRYEWTVPKNGHWPIAPAWLLEKIKGAKKVSTSALGEDQELSKNSRHPQLLRWAAQMRHHGLSADAILSALRVENETRCKPPKEDEEVVGIAKWISQKAPSEALVAVEEIETIPVEPGQYDPVRTVADYEPELDELFDQGFQPGLHPGWDNLAELVTLEPGHTTLVTGCPTAGKSTWVNALLNHMAMGYDWRAGFCSPEFHPVKYHILRYIETYQGESASAKSKAKMSRDDYEAAKVWVKDHMFFMEPESAKDRTLGFVLSMAKRLYEEKGINAFVIDPWASLMRTKIAGDRADEQLARELNPVIEFGLKTKVTPIIVIHPHMMLPDKEGKYPVVKPYDLAGGAMWYNLAYNIFSLHREKDWNHGEVDLYVWKVKYPWLGKSGQVKLFYRPSTGRYSESTFSESKPWYFRRGEQAEKEWNTEQPEYQPKYETALPEF